MRPQDGEFPDLSTAPVVGEAPQKELQGSGSESSWFGLDILGVSRE